MNSIPEKMRSHHGGILVSVLAYITITSFIIAGILALGVSHYARVKADSYYASAMPIAEAGVNYELNRISIDAAQADQSPSPSVSFGGGAFTVYVVQRNSDGSQSTPWTAPNDLYIYATGTIHGVSRTVRVASTHAAVPGNGVYAIFGAEPGGKNTTGGVSKIAGSAAVINGNVGTNGYFDFTASPTVNGVVDFDGPYAGWTSPKSGYSVLTSPELINWPTVDQIAVQQFGSLGVSYVATHNDNNLANPPINGNSISLGGNGSQTLVGKAGGANYYLTSVSMNGNSTMTFNNTNGPITVWVGPDGGSGTFSMHGGTTAVSMSTDPSKAVRFYLATTSDFTLQGNSQIDAGFYNINDQSQGSADFGGTPIINGSVISNDFNINGNITVNFVGSYFTPTSDYYRTISPWTEINSAY